MCPCVWIRHWILHKPSASINFWKNILHVIFNIFRMVNCAIFLVSGDTRSTEYEIQLQTSLMLSQLYIHLEHCGTWIILLPFLRKTSDHSFRILENLYWNFIVTFTMWKIQIVLSTLWKISQGVFRSVETISVPTTKLSFFLSVTIYIFNHLEHFFHISSIEPADLWGGLP